MPSGIHDRLKTRLLLEEIARVTDPEAQRQSRERTERVISDIDRLRIDIRRWAYRPRRRWLW